MRHTLASLLILGVFGACAQDRPQDAVQDQGQDPPARVGRLNYLSGSVSFRPGTVDEWAAATLNYPVYEGDHLWTDRDGRTEIHIGSTALRMGPETALAVLDLDDRIVQLSLTGGTLHVRLRFLGEGESFEVDTPNGAVTLLRAGEYKFFVDEARDQTTVTVRGGDVEVIGGSRGGATVVHARQGARLTGADDRYTVDVGEAPPADSFEIWCQDRDQREEQSQSVQHVSRETIGYEDLDSAGSWSEAPDYGWVWAPRVNAGWAPYRDGRWAWVEPWGWTWIDDAPWGFAPFHYGRWAMYRGGWVWVPGARVARPVYAPALVAFIGGPRGGVTLSVGSMTGVGWFPLGPHEIYRPSYRHSDYYVRQVNITHVNVTNINVTNVRYVNQNQGSVTVVSRDVFVGARPVRNAHMVVGGDVIAQGRVFGSTAPIAPERTSVMVRAQVSNVRPPSRFEGRTVVVRQAPPPPPVSFAARREALQANPGRPLDRGTAEALRRNDTQRAPAFRQASPGGTREVFRDSPREGQREVQRDIPRVDRPRMTSPDQPRPRFPQDQLPPVQRPQVSDQPRPRVQEQPAQVERPRQVDQPRPRVQEQPAQVERPRQVDQPRPRVQEQPRQVDRPRPADQPRVEQPRQEPRTERKQEARPERKNEPRKDERKEEKKQQ